MASQEPLVKKPRVEEGDLDELKRRACLQGAETVKSETVGILDQRFTSFDKLLEKGLERSFAQCEKLV